METKNRYEAGNKYGNRSMLCSNIKSSIENITLLLENGQYNNDNSTPLDIITNSLCSLGFQSGSGCSSGIYTYTRSVSKKIDAGICLVNQSLTMVLDYTWNNQSSKIVNIHSVVTLIEIARNLGSNSPYIYAYPEVTIMDILMDAYESIQDQILTECLQILF